MKKTGNFSKRLLSLLLAVLFIASLSACKPRDPQPEEDSSSDSSASIDPLEPPETSSGTAKEPEQELVDKIVAAYNKNSDVVGWLSFPNTTIDDVVLQGKDNVFYERKDITKAYNWYGCYYADAGNTFGDRNSLTSNTIIYGHNMSDKTTDVKFSSLMKLIDFNLDGVANAKDDSGTNIDFAKNNPYIYFSTVDDDMVWVIYAAFYTDTSFQYHLEKPTAAQFKEIIDGAKKRSELIYDVDVNTSDKILTLSTCCYRFGGEANKDQRFVVQARLLRPGETVKTTASVTKNPNPQRPVFN